MHTLHPYKISVFDRATENKGYAKLGSIKGTVDGFSFIETWIKANQKLGLIIDHKAKTSILFRDDFIFDFTTRTIHGWVCVGDYGVANPILDINTGKTAFDKKEHNAELIPHFVYLRIPKNYSEGLALFHGVRGKGIKSIFVELLNKEARAKLDRVFGFTTLSYGKAMSLWQDAIAKEITAIPKVVVSDVADKVNEINPRAETFVTIKAPRLGNFGTWSSFHKQGSKQYELLEVLEEQYDDIRTVIERNGKKRKLRIGTNITDDICVIEAPDNLELVGGNPKSASIVNWCKDTESDFKIKLDEPPEVPSS
ncbi:hypothetical protein KVY11_16380 [Acinetobacter sp. CWB-G5]|uniref:hypothetical protein n=1 Tax=Acinetobacter sp. CWB-G5 TaxID=2855444 RepID=UPI001C48EFB6|nr:hypothetical protein [Acinetobacter sp. CWB-G5]MBV7310243.1 hypothetical protein [Acinetobacter sp. CWB-G5]